MNNFKFCHIFIQYFSKMFYFWQPYLFYVCFPIVEMYDQWALKNWKCTNFKLWYADSNSNWKNIGLPLTLQDLLCLYKGQKGTIHFSVWSYHPIFISKSFAHFFVNLIDYLIKFSLNKLKQDTITFIKLVCSKKNYVIYQYLSLQILHFWFLALYFILGYCQYNCILIPTRIGLILSYSSVTLRDALTQYPQANTLSIG